MLLNLEILPWAIAVLALVAAVVILLFWRQPRRSSRHKPLPLDWDVAPRPVFNSDERRVYRQLREALPHHIILSKLPLLRFCQPNDPARVRYWYEILGASNVSFAICSTNGRVLAAVDLETERGQSPRTLQIKQSVMGACRIRYLRCPIDHMPTVAELQLLVPQSAAVRGPQPAPAEDLLAAREAVSVGRAAARRQPRKELWQDSAFFQDSFFASDGREEGPASDFSPFQGSPGRPTAEAEESPRPRDPLFDDIAGIVIDDSPKHDEPPSRR